MTVQSAWERGILTHAQTIRRISYTPAQLHLLTVKFGFPLPVDYGDGYRIGWEWAAVEGWMRGRADLRLLT